MKLLTQPRALALITFKEPGQLPGQVKCSKSRRTPCLGVELLALDVHVTRALPHKTSLPFPFSRHPNNISSEESGKK